MLRTPNMIESASFTGYINDIEKERELKNFIENFFLKNADLLPLFPSKLTIEVEVNSD